MILAESMLLLPEFGLLFWGVIILLVLLFILRKFAWKPILGALEARENSIDEALSSAEKAREEMAKLSADNERLLKEAREERAAMLKEAKATSDKMVDDAKERAKAEQAKMIADAKHEIETQKNAALTQVKNEVGVLAVNIAEKLTRVELAKDGAQTELVNKLVAEFK